MHQIGMLRQWLNEKSTERLVTNADILLWLTNNQDYAKVPEYFWGTDKQI